MEEIFIKWEGPYRHKEMTPFDKGEDYGLYQIYGDHPIYGKNVLLYIGMTNATNMTFASRVTSKNDWECWDDLTIFLGRFGGTNSLESDEEWTRQIKFCEALMIYYFTPAWNAHGINSTKLYNEYENVKIYNFGIRMSLPEIVEKGIFTFDEKIDAEKLEMLEKEWKCYK